MQNISEDSFQKIFNYIDDFLFILDESGNIIEFNDAVTRILGYSKDELAGRSVLVVHPPEFRDDAANTVAAMLKGEKFSCPVPIISKSGEYIPVETRVWSCEWNGSRALVGLSRNLSEIKLSEEKFQTVFRANHVPMAISTFDTGVFIDINDAFTNMLEFSRDEIIGKSSKELNVFLDYSQRDRVVELFVKNGRVNDLELEMKTKSGKTLTCLFSIDRIRIQTHEFLLTSAIDITLRKDVEKVLSHFLDQQTLLANISQKINKIGDHEKKLNDILETLGTHTGVDRIYIFENIDNGRAARNTFEWCAEGIEPQKVLLQNVSYDTIPSLKKIFEDDGKFFSKNVLELPKDLVSHLEPQGIKSILAYPLSVQGWFYGFVGFDECGNNKEWRTDETELLRTVTNIISNYFERRLIKTQLRESELRQKLAMESAGEGLWDWNIATGEVYFSETWCSMLGYSTEEIEPNVKSWEKLVHPEDMPEVMKALNLHLDDKTEYYETTHRVKSKDGQWRWILDHGKVVERNSDKKPLRAVGTHIDVTRQKDIERSLKEVIATRDKLFSIIAHDLRGLIGSLMNITEFMTENSIDEKTQNEFMHDIKNNSKNAYKLLENLLNWSRSQQNAIFLKISAFSMCKTVDNCIRILAREAANKNISLTHSCKQEHFAFADPDMISIVIRNLISNAIKFTRVGGIIDINSSEKDGMLNVKITDTGIGIKKEILENIFNPNLFNTTYGTDNEKGSGLGLKLCKDFVERNGGKIWCETSINHGSTFLFTVPLCNN